MVSVTEKTIEEDFIEIVAILVMALLAARRRKEQQELARQQRLRKDAEKARREYDNRWDVKHHRRIDAAKQVVKERFSPETASLINGHLDVFGKQITELADSSVDEIGREELARQIAQWERHISALSFADRGLLPMDDRRVECAKAAVEELKESQQSQQPEQSAIIPPGIDPVTAGVLGADWERLEPIAARSAEQMSQLAAESQGATSSSDEFRREIKKFFEKSQAKRQQRRSAQTDVSQALKSQTSVVKKKNDELGLGF